MVEALESPGALVNVDGVSELGGVAIDGVDVVLERVLDTLVDELIWVVGVDDEVDMMSVLVMLAATHSKRANPDQTSRGTALGEFCGRRSNERQKAFVNSSVFRSRE